MDLLPVNGGANGAEQLELRALLEHVAGRAGAQQLGKKCLVRVPREADDGKIRPPLF